MCLRTQCFIETDSLSINSLSVSLLQGAVTNCNKPRQIKVNIIIPQPEEFEKTFTYNAEKIHNLRKKNNFN